MLVTGQTGFKGSWLALWLCALEAEPHGFALAPITDPAHFDLHDWTDAAARLGDVRDAAAVAEAVDAARPEVVFHMAAQPLVRESYRNPVETFASNVMGTAHVLQACLATPGVKAVVIVTSDKVYENNESGAAFLEGDRLGGSDPYSCSKGCAELVTESYRRSFYEVANASGAPLLASVRAGNVIGGGDWSADRLIPDAVRAAAAGGVLSIRSPESIRPWQHVLEPLAGYLRVGQRLLEGDADAAAAWNFGPDEEGHVCVRQVVDAFREEWPDFQYQTPPTDGAMPESKCLRLDSTAARERLGWRPVWDWRTTIRRTAAWYRAYHCDGRVTTSDDLAAYVAAARELGCGWARA